MPGPDQILVLNCGSSSAKLAVIDAETGVESAHGLVERLSSPEAQLLVRAGDRALERKLPGADHRRAVREIVELLSELELTARISAVGHRVVHGGETFQRPTLIDETVIARVREVSRLAPLHNPANLMGIEAASDALPGRPQVAVFDTAFHQTMPPEAFLYAIPHELYDRHGVRRYGFHGTSHEFVSLEAARRLGRDDAALITAHLGNGCSAAAILNGRSVETTMGLTPLEGLVMGTRSGDVDPGMLPMLAEITGRDLDGVVKMLNRESGLLGLSGLSNDMRTLLEARADGHERAKTAIDVFCHRLARSILGLAASLPRLDALVFTGGIGENAPDIRAETLARLGLLGFELDAGANRAQGSSTDGRITQPDSPLALVIPTNEELMIARHTRTIIEKGPA